MLLLTEPAFAAGLEYHVEIDAPSPLADLLRNNLGVLRWQGSDYIDKEQLDRLYEATPREIEALLAPQGYFNPKVKSVMQPERAGWRLRFTVEPGEPTSIRDVELQIEGAIRQEPDFQTRWAELLEVWPLPIGANFTQPDWDAAKRRGLQALLIDRFPAAAIKDSRAEVDPVQSTAELSVVYNSGPRFTFGDLSVNGLNKYPRKLVERLQTFQAGEPYSQQKLLDFQTALQNTPYFASVFLDVPIDSAKPENVPVRLEVTEAPRYKTDAGVGFDTDKGPRASLAFRDSNLRQLGWIGSLNLNLQRREQTFNAGVELPVDLDGYRYGSSYKVEHSDVAGLDKTTQTLGVQRSRLKGRIEVTQAIQYTNANERLDGEETKFNKALIFSQSWTRNGLDKPADPQRGLLLSWQLGGAAKALLSDTNFVRAWGRAAWYHPLGEKGLVLFRGEAGQVLADNTDSVPSDWLFRAGGAGSVRGYGYQTLGVKAENGAVQGGRLLLTGSAEYQHRVVGPWRAAVFADVGNAANDWLSFKAYKGYGVGARYISPVGPFALDVAYGAADRKVRLHFSLGVGF
ncbi:autotransporter assembly complex protein TamA [Chitinimonas naiadis]